MTRQRRKLAFAVRVAPADPLRVEPVVTAVRADAARLARLVLPAVALLALASAAIGDVGGEGVDLTFLANLFDKLGRWWNGLPLWQQALVIGGGVALLMLGGASWAFALGATGVAADIASRGQGLATFLRDPRAATRDFVRTLTPADVVTYSAGAVLNRLLGPLTNRTVGRWLGEAGEEAAETATERAAREAAEAATSSRLVPGGGLAAHEALGGHTLARHVGQTPDQLRTRLDQTGYGAISTYTDRATAEAAVAEAIDAHKNAIESWLLTEKSRLQLDHVHDMPVGTTLLQNATEPALTNGSRLVLQRAPGSPLGYRIVTSFPRTPSRVSVT